MFPFPTVRHNGLIFFSNYSTIFFKRKVQFGNVYKFVRFSKTSQKNLQKIIDLPVFHDILCAFFIQFTRRRVKKQ